MNMAPGTGVSGAFSLPAHSRLWPFRFRRSSGQLMSSQPRLSETRASLGELSDPRSAEGERRRGAPITPRELRLIGNAAMLDAIGKARIGRFAAKVEIGFSRVPHRPFADPVIEIEQARLVGNFGAWLCRDQPPGRSRRDRSLLLARTLPDESTGADRSILHFGR